MYAYLNGIIKDIESNYIVLDINGIGYLIYVANPYYYQIENSYKVYTYTHIREDEFSLYGFKSKEELEQVYLENNEDKIDAVVICALHKAQNKLVLINQYRVPINKYIYELPAGLVDNNEDIETSVRRELKDSEELYRYNSLTNEVVLDRTKTKMRGAILLSDGCDLLLEEYLHLKSLEVKFKCINKR